MLRSITLLSALLLLPAFAAADEAERTDWSKHMGKLAFTVGWERGKKEVAFTGRPGMLFFTSQKDPWCPKFAKRTFSDPKVIELVADYTPILIDADSDEGKKLKEAHAVVLLPGVVWLDFDGDSVFSALGDSPLDVFRQMVEVAKERAPKAREPGEGHDKLIELRDAMRKAAKGKKVPPILEAIAAVREFGVGAEVQLEADRIDADLTEKGDERIAKAKALIEKRRKSSAKSALKKVIADYGDHPVGKRAKELLATLES
jgi:hypothetical protein